MLQNNEPLITPQIANTIKEPVKKMSQNHTLITPQISDTIKNLAKELELTPDLGERISAKVNEQCATNFTTNFIRQYLKDKLDIKIPQNRSEPFTEQIDNHIKELMKEYRHSSNLYAQVTEIINKDYNMHYTSKQIRQRWISRLDTNLCHGPLDDEEKFFIIQWVESTQRGDKINWKKLIPLMKTEFGKLRSENMVKNYWNSRKRRIIKSKAKDQQQPQIKVEKCIKSSLPNGENDHPPPSNVIPMETSFEKGKSIYSPPLNLMRTLFPLNTSLTRTLPPLNASSMRVLPPLNENPMRTLPPLNASSMETSFKKENILPPLNTSSMRVLPPLNENPMRTLPPLNASSMEASFKKENILPPLNTSSMETSFEKGKGIYSPPIGLAFLFLLIFICWQLLRLNSALDDLCRCTTISDSVTGR
ncbi:hypothetical protein RclHR1_05000009 [Rhizophagus clarus]|uniref:HTH myb-type domain-containing protein n=1 Tax=Rhizophagus clarus TaxID=94130 RepID=A0A2Z6RKC9_9GLOM|nr:hypothetical protein RclHR1_05000009 [Rhizophagus clarus]